MPNAKILPFIVCIVIFSSCFQRADRIIYATPPANVPYLDQKGDSKLTGYISAGNGGRNTDQSGGYGVQGAYAITNNWIVMGGYNRMTMGQVNRYDSMRYHISGLDVFDFGGTYVETNIFDSSVAKSKSSVFQIGTGYSIPLDRKKTLTYSIYGGIDFGKFTINDAGLDSVKNPYTRYYSVSIAKPWLQGAFNFGSSKSVLACSLGGRLSFLHFGTANTTYSSAELNYFYLDKIDNNTLILLEPYVNLQFRVPSLNWLKIEGQVSACTGYGSMYPKFSTLNGSVGLTVDVTKALRKKK